METVSIARLGMTLKRNGYKVLKFQNSLQVLLENRGISSMEVKVCAESNGIDMNPFGIAGYDGRVYIEAK